MVWTCRTDLELIKEIKCAFVIIDLLVVYVNSIASELIDTQILRFI